MEEGEGARESNLFIRTVLASTRRAAGERRGADGWQTAAVLTHYRETGRRRRRRGVSRRVSWRLRPARSDQRHVHVEQQTTTGDPPTRVVPQPSWPPSSKHLRVLSRGGDQADREKQNRDQFQRPDEHALTCDHDDVPTREPIAAGASVGFVARVVVVGQPRGGDSVSGRRRIVTTRYMEQETRDDVSNQRRHQRDRRHREPPLPDTRRPGTATHSGQSTASRGTAVGVGRRPRGRLTREEQAESREMAGSRPADSFWLLQIRRSRRTAAPRNLLPHQGSSGGGSVGCGSVRR
jgi:hypothetical protein